MAEAVCLAADELFAKAENHVKTCAKTAQDQNQEKSLVSEALELFELSRTLYARAQNCAPGAEARVSNMNSSQYGINLFLFFLSAC
jgi:hypothetical protein